MELLFYGAGSERACQRCHVASWVVMGSGLVAATNPLAGPEVSVVSRLPAMSMRGSLLGFSEGGSVT